MKSLFESKYVYDCVQQPMYTSIYYFYFGAKGMLLTKKHFS